MNNNAKISITFRHMDSSPVMEQQARKLLEKLNKFLEHERTPIIIELVLEAQLTHHHHRAELRVQTPRYTLNAHREGPEMYKILDEVVDVMTAELRKAKDKQITKDRKGATEK